MCHPVQHIWTFRCLGHHFNNSASVCHNLALRNIVLKKQIKAALKGLPELSPAPPERQILFEIQGDGCIVVCGAAATPNVLWLSRLGIELS